MPSEGRDTPVTGEVGEHSLCCVDGNGKADAGALVGAVGGDHGVDANDLAMRVEQRPAGVAGIDGGIGLNGVFNRRASAFWIGRMALMMPRGHGAGQAEGIADGVDLLPDGELEESASVTGCRLGALICSSARS